MSGFSTFSFQYQYKSVSNVQDPRWGTGERKERRKKETVLTNNFVQYLLLL